MSWNLAPRSLKNEHVILEPLTMRLFDETCDSMIPDTDGWYAVMFGLNTHEAYLKEFSDAETFAKARHGMGFAIRDVKSNAIAGITFLLKMDSENRQMEIGTTNIAPRFRRTYVNTASKVLLLQEAFEKFDCIRVAFRVDEENIISQRAVERLGGQYGGLLRHERILPDGRIRNYKFYSIIASEWPDIKTRLLHGLQSKA
jgi:RimJ/RimL family protein N-acetyltransferase